MISGNSLVFSRKIIASIGFYRCYAPGASAPVVVKNQSPKLCKQRSSTVSRKLQTVSKKAASIQKWTQGEFSEFFFHSPHEAAVWPSGYMCFPFELAPPLNPDKLALLFCACIFKIRSYRGGGSRNPNLVDRTCCGHLDFAGREEILWHPSCKTLWIVQAARFFQTTWLR